LGHTTKTKKNKKQKKEVKKAIWRGNSSGFKAYPQRVTMDIHAGQLEFLLQVTIDVAFTS